MHFHIQKTKMGLAPNRRGFALVEVLVAVGLLTLIAAGVAALVTFTVKQQAGIQAKDQQREVTADIRTLLNNRTACLNTFGGQNPTPAAGFTVLNVRDAANAIRYSVGGNDKSGLLTITTMRVSNWMPDAGYTDMGTAIFRVGLNKKAGKGGPQSLLPDIISLKVKLNGTNQITECFSLGTNEDGLWQISPFNSSNIYFAGGNVGIGMDNPTEALEVSGNILADAVFWTSDKNLKNIDHRAHGLSTVRKLNGYHFTWKKTGKKDVGLLAQEVESVLPEIVMTDDEEIKHVSYSGIIPVLVEAIKELDAKNKALEKKIKALEKRP